MNNNEYYIAIEERIKILQELRKVGTSLAKGIIGKSLFKEDLFFCASLDRCMNLIDGFVVMLRKRNLTCVGALLRLQMDNCMRSYAAFIAKDKQAVINCIISGEQINKQESKDNIFLLGESQGGFVASYVAGTRPEDIRGLVALYPAYVLQDDAWSRTPDPENIPETMKTMGQKIGRIYNVDAMSFDIYDVIGSYTGNVLIIHGTKDRIAPISYSERAAEVFPSAELVRVEGAGHGFHGKDEKEAAELSVEFVKKNLS